MRQKKCKVVGVRSLRCGQIESEPNHDAVVRARLKLAAHQGSICINAAFGLASDFAHQSRTAIAVASHALIVEIDQIVRYVLAVALADECRPGFGIGAARAAGGAVEGYRSPAFFMR